MGGSPIFRQSIAPVLHTSGQTILKCISRQYFLHFLFLCIFFLFLCFLISFFFHLFSYLCYSFFLSMQNVIKIYHVVQEL